MSDETSKMIAGLMEDNKRLKERVQFLEDLAEENRSEFENLRKKNERLKITGDALSRIVVPNDSNREEYQTRWLAWQAAKEVQS